MSSSDKLPKLDQLICLAGKRAIVTGGATGIGKSITYRLAEAGAAVLIADIDSTNAEHTAKEFSASGYNVSCVACDISNNDSITNMVATAANTLGGIDILVNNAGIYPRKLLSEMTSADFEQVVSVNLTGLFNCSRLISRHMIEQKQGGCIINIGSIDSFHPSHKGLSAYDASKGGVEMLTKSLALELGQYGIRVNTIAPGGILTESMMSTVKGVPTKEGMAQLKAFMSRTALGRMGSADDVGRVALFLASELSNYVTGTTVVVDGGYLIS